MKKTSAVIAFRLTFIIGALLIFIGARFLLLPGCYYLFTAPKSVTYVAL